MHKNPHQNAGNGIKETLFFKIFLESMPLEPPKFLSLYAYVQAIHKALKQKWILSNCPIMIAYYDKVCAKKGYPLKSSTCAGRSNLNSLTS